MRPGQAAPEFSSEAATSAEGFQCFNEAGAGCPGIRPAHRGGGRPGARASMRPGQAAPEFNPSLWKTGFANSASMRPGQAAPEFSEAEDFRRPAVSSFNEAGAGCPGILNGKKHVYFKRRWLQ